MCIQQNMLVWKNKPAYFMVYSPPTFFSVIFSAFKQRAFFQPMTRRMCQTANAVITELLWCWLEKWNFVFKLYNWRGDAKHVMPECTIYLKAAFVQIAFTRDSTLQLSGSQKHKCWWQMGEANTSVKLHIHFAIRPSHGKSFISRIQSSLEE